MENKFKDIEITDEQALILVKNHYGIEGDIKRLAGDVDFNFYLKTSEKEFSVKISRPGTSKDEWLFQSAIMEHLSKKKLPFQTPSLVKSLDGDQIIELEKDRLLRVQNWVGGRMIGSLKPHNKSLLSSWGKMLGYMSNALADFEHPSAHRRFKWDPSNTLDSKAYAKYFTSPKENTLANYFWNLFKDEAKDVLPLLRSSINYNDAHEQNLLISKITEELEIDGIIDFGDAVYTQTINEIAIACAYGAMHKKDPLSAICTMVSAYHKVFPITEEECTVLLPMIGARLMITVSNAAWAKHNEPENKYLCVSEQSAWDLLKKLKVISPRLAVYAFRTVCGFETCPLKIRFDLWIKGKPQFADVIDFSDRKMRNIDLSIGSLILGNNDNYATTAKFTKHVQRWMEDNGVDIAYGGYGEARPIYTNDLFQDITDEGPDWRTIHLGLDFWTPENEAVFAPLNATVLSIHDNAGDLNYGPTVILKHEVKSDFVFYTLYGHLNNWCIQNLKEGQTIAGGQKIGEVGAPILNGNWPPHLHFQVMLDMLEDTTDFQGVAYAVQKNLWLGICPNPALLINQDLSNPIKVELTAIAEKRQKNLGKSLSVSYKKPLYIVRGFMQYLYDNDGRRYLDTANNVAHVGHEHPRVVKAAQKQMGLLNTNSRYLHDNITAFAEALLKKFPEELSVVHFVNSGSEANELAIRMAKTFTAQKDMIALEVGYHGSTGACIDVSSYKFDGKGGKGAPEYTRVVPIPDVYRGRHKGKNAGEDYANYIKTAIANIKSKDRNIAGFICESILSCGGQIVLPEGFLQKAFAHVKNAGGLNIIDEVQVGFGRVGSHYWGFELQGVVPDIVTMGKPIGNGHPLAAVVTTRTIADAFANGMEYFSTFGGNPVSCAIGKEVLDIIEEEGLQKHALDMGKYIKAGLRKLQVRHPIIGDIRGEGLFLGFELVRDKNTLEPADTECAYLANRMRALGFLLSTDGPFHNVIKLKPPMCITRENVDLLLEYIDKVLGESFMKS